MLIEELLSVSGYYRDWPVIDSIPAGWKECINIGSPLSGHIFVSNQKNILSGQRIIALAPAVKNLCRS
jgi:hypothetical protein